MKQMRQTATTPRLLVVLLAALCLAALFLATPAAASVEPTQCSSQSCFKQAFRQCQPVTFMTRGGLGAQAKYAIEGEVADGCRLSLTFVENPNPAWVDKPVTFVLDPAGSLDEQIEAAVPACLAGSGGEFHCDGPLAGITGRAEATSTSADATPAGSPCGQSVTVSGEPLYAMREDGKWGYVNRAGDWVIEPQWPTVRRFSEGRAIVRVKGHWWNVIDRSGGYILESHIESLVSENGHSVPPLKPFSQGCAAVARGANPDAMPWFLTRDGAAWLKQPKLAGLTEGATVYEYGPFHEGKAWIRVYVGDLTWKYGWIDSSGKVVIEPKFAEAGNFVNGLAPAAVQENFWGYFDTKGNLVLPGKPTLKMAQAFSQGLAAVAVDTYGPWLYTDRKDFVIEAMRFSEPRLAKEFGSKPVRKSEFKIGYAGAFHSGLALVKPHDYRLTDSNGLVYIDKTGQVAIDPEKTAGIELCSARGFHNGLARLLAANKNSDNCAEETHYLYIDSQGSIVLQERQGSPST